MKIARIWIIDRYVTVEPKKGTTEGNTYTFTSAFANISQGAQKYQCVEKDICN
jgi:hypothetical protein